jgi:DNA-3-methyladenine glycosylase
MTISLSKQDVLGKFVQGASGLKVLIFDRSWKAVSKKLDPSYYHQGDVLSIARDLLGKLLVTRWDGRCTAGRIVETEAYRGETDRASHAWNGRRTARTAVMYGTGGHAYVYLCYGIHHLFNVVTHKVGIPHVVLVRAIEPVEGITVMTKRTGKPPGSISLGAGPGNLTRSLGIHTAHNGYSLQGPGVSIHDDGFRPEPGAVLSTPRIGVDYAGEDAKLPYRFILSDNPYLSGPRHLNIPLSAAYG